MHKLVNGITENDCRYMKMIVLEEIKRKPKEGNQNESLQSISHQQSLHKRQ